MARNKLRWVCQECGFQSSGQLGRCTECNSWNSLVEEEVSDSTSQRALAKAANPGPQLLADVPESGCTRIASGLTALDNVLGGGLVPGAVVLLAGDPGVGKSTLLLQIANLIASDIPVMYVTGEESCQQVKLRAQRLAVLSTDILVFAEQNVATIERHLLESQVGVAIIDSIQSLYHPELTASPGSVSQVRECAGILASAARSRGIATIIVGHVTKDGSIAGPRVLEHMVDVVLQFEGESVQQLRLLRATKNRFGSTATVAVFTMSTTGLAEVENPNYLFLGNRLNQLAQARAPSGTAIIAGAEGSQTLLFEVQALVGISPYPGPRRVANGWEINRLLQILAVLERKAGLTLSRHDVYINIVGGFDFSDPAGDLGVCVAVATSFLNRSIDPRLIVVGEVGLTGEVRPVTNLTRRLEEAARLGFRQALVPQGNLPLAAGIEQMEIKGVDTLIEALAAVAPGEHFTESSIRPGTKAPADFAAGATGGRFRQSSTPDT